jgi:hypothetical protein
VKTDMLLTMTVPFLYADEATMSLPVADVLAGGGGGGGHLADLILVFRLFLISFEIKDWSLFNA